MGAIDLEGKNYLSIRTIFADLFNFYLYGGKQVIQPKELKELDTTQIAIPYGNGARVPVQKYRDVLKLWAAMMDENAIYVMLGIELQNKIHYAMPVKKGLYDMIGYARQVEEAGRSYRKKDEPDSLFVEEGALKIKLTSEEFLSGFRKEDKLLPIITATVYLSPEEWDGPMDLHDMLDVKDKTLLKFIPNYPINLIAPANIKDEDFGKFSTDLGLAMKILKHQKTGIIPIIEAEKERKIDRNTAVFLNNVAKLGLVFDEKEGEIMLCQEMEENNKKMKITGAIEYMKDEGKTENDIISKIMEKYHVTKEYVLMLLTPKTV